MRRQNNNQPQQPQKESKRNSCVRAYCINIYKDHTVVLLVIIVVVAAAVAVSVVLLMAVVSFEVDWIHHTFKCIWAECYDFIILQILNKKRMRKRNEIQNW